MSTIATNIILHNLFNSSLFSRITVINVVNVRNWWSLSVLKYTTKVSKFRSRRTVQFRIDNYLVRFQGCISPPRMPRGLNYIARARLIHAGAAPRISNSDRKDRKDRRTRKRPRGRKRKREYAFGYPERAESSNILPTAIFPRGMFVGSWKHHGLWTRTPCCGRIRPRGGLFSVLLYVIEQIGEHWTRELRNIILNN